MRTILSSIQADTFPNFLKSTGGVNHAPTSSPSLYFPKLAIVVIGLYLGFKREFSKLIGFLVVSLVAVGLVFNADGVKDILLELLIRLSVHRKKHITLPLWSKL